MSCTTTPVGMEWMTVIAVTDAAAVFVPASAWLPCAGVTAAKGWGELAHRTGNLSVTPAVQFANDVRAPNLSATAVGAAMIAAGVSDPNGNTTLSTGAFKYLRVGWNVVLTSGSSVGSGVVSGVIELIRS